MTQHSPPSRRSGPEPRVPRPARTLRSLLTAAAILAALLPTLPLHADVRADARQLFQEGMALVAQERFTEGVARLEQAYELLPHPVVLYNIGRAWTEAGEYGRALPFLERYLATNPADREDVEALAERLRRRLALEGAGERVRPGAPVATDEELQTIDAAAEQLSALAELSGSAEIDQRARRLRRLAADLRARRVVAAQASGAGADGVTAVSAVRAVGDTPAPDQEDLMLAAGAEMLLLETAPEIGLEVYEEQVVSASRFARSTLDAPYSSSTVTAQDIRLSGLRTVPDLLRRLAGLEVMTLTPGDQQVSLRGLNQRLSNKMLVMIDGRSVFLDFLGATMWATLPVAVEDIERIEVIRGPASANYGADAFTGIVNIITKEPGEADSHVGVGAGNAGQVRAVASVSGRTEDGLGWRMGGGFEQADPYSVLGTPEREDVSVDSETGLSRMWADAELHQRTGRDWAVGAGGAVSTFSTTLQAISRLRELRADDGLFSQAWGRLDMPGGFSLRTFWNFLRTDVHNLVEADGGIPVAADDLVSHAADVELVWARRLELTVPHDLVLGLGYRFKYIDFDWLQGREMEHHASLFFEDTMSFSRWARLTVSGRIDRHPLLDTVQVSPRASLVLRPTEQTAIRAIAGTAFRSPTFMESYLRIANQTPYRGVSALGMGNRELDPEQIQSLELGLTQHLGAIAALELNGYYNLIDGQILLSRISPYVLSDYPGYDPETAAHPVGELRFTNEDALYRQLGGELGVRVWPAQGFDLFANYALHDTSPQDPEAVLAGRELDQRTSAHKVNGGVQYRSPFGLDLSLEGHWVSRQVWVEQVTDPTTGVRFQAFELDPYLLVNARLGWRFFDGDLDLGVVATNLLDQRHREHPFGQTIGRRVLGTATVSF